MAAAIILLSTVLSIVVVFWAARFQIYSKTKSQTILIQPSKSPNHINSFDIAWLIIKSVLKNVPGSRPPLSPSTGTGQEFSLPSIQVEGELNIQDEDFKNFNAAVSQTTTGSSLPETVSLFFLIAQTIPLLVYILSDSRCPIKPLGTVNTSNCFQILDPTFCRNMFAMRASAKARELTYKATFGGPQLPGRRQKRGVEFRVLVEILKGTRIVMRQELGILQSLHPSVRPRYDLQSAKFSGGDVHHAHVDSSSACNQIFRMDATDPKRWAVATKDYNFIHVSKLGAKLFGFSSVIAHGNHTAALAVQKLLDTVPRGEDENQREARRLLWEADDPFKIDIRFLRPMLLPASATVSWLYKGGNESGIDVAVSRKEKVCLEGSITSIATDTQK